MTPREGSLARGALAILAIEVAVAGVLALMGSIRCDQARKARPANQHLVSELGLADLALWSDASYCRHSSLRTFFAAHSDHPSAMEHFPAGSLVPPPLPDARAPKAAP